MSALSEEEAARNSRRLRKQRQRDRLAARSLRYDSDATSTRDNSPSGRVPSVQVIMGN